MTITTARPLSAGRVQFIRDLLAERTVPADAAARLSARLDAGTVDNAAATAAIEWLKRQVSAAEVVPAGRYAVATTSADAVNGLAFYRVDRPTEGRWAGCVFVKLVTGDDEQRLSRGSSAAVLRSIAEVGAEAASAAYGREIGACGVCGRTLTNDASRARGIGPVCAEGNGW